MDLFDIVAARVGGGPGGGSGVPQVQSDWNQNDSSKKDYVKNRTHWKEEVERDYTVLPNAEPDPITDFIEFGKKIGLEIGKEYTLEFYLTDGTIETIQTTAIEFPLDAGIAGVPCVMVENICQIIDGIVLDLVAETTITGDNCYYQFDSDAAEVLEKGVILNLPNTETVIHKIPKEYLPQEDKVDQVFNSESKNAQSGIAIEEFFNIEYKPYIYKGELQLLCDTVTTDYVSKIQLTQNKITGKNFRLRRVFIHIEIPSYQYPISIQVGVLVNGSSDYQNVTPKNNDILLPQANLSASADIVIEPLCGKTIFVTYGMDKTGKEYSVIGEAAVPQYSYIHTLHYGDDTLIRGIEITGYFSSGTKVSIWGENEI